MCLADSATRRPRSRTTASRVDVVGEHDPKYAGLHRLARYPAVTDAGTGLSLYGRAEATLTGAFEYDDLNTQSQDAYSLANLGRGPRAPRVRRGWIRNAFDTGVHPIASYGALAPSGFIGEMGRPRTFGISAGWAFERSKVKVQSREVSEKHNELVVSS